MFINLYFPPPTFIKYLHVKKWPLLNTQLLVVFGLFESGYLQNFYSSDKTLSPTPFINHVNIMWSESFFVKWRKVGLPVLLSARILQLLRIHLRTLRHPPQRPRCQYSSRKSKNNQIDNFFSTEYTFFHSNWIQNKTLYSIKS